VTFTWGEAANLLSAAARANTDGWTRAAKGNLKRAIEKLAEATPMDDPNAFFLIVRGQTIVKGAPAPRRRLRGLEGNPTIEAHHAADAAADQKPGRTRG
jgi:hypothetical protein